MKRAMLPVLQSRDRHVASSGLGSRVRRAAAADVAAAGAQHIDDAVRLLSRAADSVVTVVEVPEALCRPTT
jgi:hypothetical protein